MRSAHPRARPIDVPASIARRLVRAVGGRFSIEMGIATDRSAEEVERWFLAATLFGNRISSRLVERTYRTFYDAGIATIADVSRTDWGELVTLLDEGGYIHYDLRTASRLQTLAEVVARRYGGQISLLADCRKPRALEEALDALPGWGPITTRLFLRELRGLWPGAEPPIDRRVVAASHHLGLPEDLRGLVDLALTAGLDPRDLEAGLLRMSLEHERDFDLCPGGPRCSLLVG